MHHRHIVKMMWAVNMYNDWHRNRMTLREFSNQILRADLDMLNSFTEADLSFALS